MSWSSDTGRGHVNFARVSPRVGDEFVDAVDGDRWMDLHHERSTYETCDRGDVVNEIEVKRLIESRIYSVCDADQEQRVPIRRGSCDGFGAYIGSRARSIFDDEGLTEPLRQPLAY